MASNADEGWPVPALYTSELLLLEPLRHALVELDTAAYLSSPRAITAYSHGAWPINGFDREENLRLIAQHEREHEDA